jgi:dihydrofolate synthase/folylpolyglutamate synthase
VRENPETILDGAHNPAGARALAAYIGRFYGGRRVRLIFGAMRDKAVDEIAGILFPRAAEVVLTAPHQARAMAPAALREVTGYAGARVAASLEEALALPAEGCDVTFITGSLFMAGEARELLGAARRQARRLL